MSETTPPPTDPSNFEQPEPVESIGSQDLYLSLINALRGPHSYFREGDAFYADAVLEDGTPVRISEYSSNWLRDPAVTREDRVRILAEGVPWISFDDESEVDPQPTYSVVKPAHLGRLGAFALDIIKRGLGVETIQNPDEPVVFQIATGIVVPDPITDPYLLAVYSRATDLAG